jgi:hypothetical protein
VYEDYGNLAGFMGFAGAGDAEPTPVVRYQDLQRGHAPASAGAMAVYQNPDATLRQGDFEENLDGYGDVAYGDVAYGDVPAPPPEFAGVQPLPVPKSVPAYAGPSTYGVDYPAPKGSPTAADLEDYPELEYDLAPSDDIKAYVYVAQVKLISLGYLPAKKTSGKSKGKSNADGYFGSDTQSAVKAFQKKKGLSQTGTVGSDTWLALYGKSRSSGSTSDKKKTSRDAAEESDTQQSGAFWRELAYSAGLSRSQDVQAASGDTFMPSSESKSGPDWQKIALWSGVAVGGILLTAVVIKAVK